MRLWVMGGLEAAELSVDDGWGASIDGPRGVVTLGFDGLDATVVVSPPRAGSAVPSVRVSGDPGARRDQLARLVAALQASSGAAASGIWEQLPPDVAVGEGAPAPRDGPGGPPTDAVGLSGAEGAERPPADGAWSELAQWLAPPQWLPFGLLFLLAFALVVGRSLRELSARQRLALTAIVVYGVLARAGLAMPAPMTAWPYARELPLAQAVAESAWLAAVTEVWGPLGFDAIVRWTSFLLAALSPLALFAHARWLLKSVPAALVAAALLAALPQAVRFAKADTYFIQSLTLSSVTFAALYGMLSDPSARWRRAMAVAFLGLAAATLVTRPLNILFAPVFFGAIVLTAPRSAPAARRWGAMALVAVVASWSVCAYLLPDFSGEVRSGLSLDTLATANAVWWNPELHITANPRVTPLVVLALLALGAWRMSLRQPGVLALLGGWYAGFFVAHAAVVASGVPMQARYHLHLVTPVCLLAACATPWLIRQRRGVFQATLGLALLSPVLHAPFIQDVDYTVMHEHAFLRAHLPSIPDGCRVLEHRPLRALNDRGVPRIPRHASTVRGFGGRWQRLKSEPFESAFDEPVEAIASRAATALEPGGCTYFYEGPVCWFDTPDVLDPDLRARGCVALLAAATWEPVAEATWVHQLYDRWGWSFRDSAGLRPLEPFQITARLWRRVDER